MSLAVMQTQRGRVHTRFQVGETPTYLAFLLYLSILNSSTPHHFPWPETESRSLSSPFAPNRTNVRKHTSTYKNKEERSRSRFRDNPLLRIRCRTRRRWGHSSDGREGGRGSDEWREESRPFSFSGVLYRGTINADVLVCGVYLKDRLRTRQPFFSLFWKENGEGVMMTDCWEVIERCVDKEPGTTC